MPDPFTVWLSHVDQLLHLGASISDSLARISRNIGIVLACVLGMYLYVRRFRRELKAISTNRRQPVGKKIAKKRKPQSRSAST